LKRKILFSLLSLVLVMSLVIPMGCMPKRDATTPTTDAERIAALESKVNQLQSKIASLPESNSTDYSGDINALYDEIDNLSMELDDILAEVDDMLAAWEEEQASSDNGSSSSNGEVATTRWTPSVFLEGTISSSLYVDPESIDWYPVRIKEEDSYRITFDIKNDTSEDKDRQVLVIALTPTNRGATSVDIYNTGLYADQPKYIGWDEAEYNPSSGVDCKGIEFISDPFTVPDGGLTDVSVIFDLYYAE
jgi:hypothetical protein